MANKKINAAETPIWFIIASGAVAILAVAALYILLKPDKTPEKFVNLYVKAIREGKCDRAYAMLSYSAKKSMPEASSLNRFAESVCDRAANDFTSIEVRKFTEVRLYGDDVSIDFVVHYILDWNARPIERSRTFELRREGGKWKLSGPELVP